MRIRVPVRVPTNEKSRNTFIIVILVMFIFTSFIMLFAGASELVTKKEIEDISSVAYDNVITDNEYYFDSDMLVIDTYAFTQNQTTSAVTKKYAIVVFSDKHGDFCYASLETTANDEIYGDVTAYENDDNAGIGDLVLSGYFRCKDIRSLESDIQVLYAKARNDCKELLGGATSNLHFVYDASDPEAYNKKTVDNASTLIIIGMVGMLITVTCLVVAIKKRRGSKQNDIRTSETFQ